MKLLKRARPEKTESFSSLFLDKYPTNSRYAEAYRTLWTSIHFSSMEKELRSLLITSAGQDEGKTITAANLAYTMSRAGRSVLMIDADLRKAMLSRLIPSRKSPGLTGLISDLFSADIRKGSLDHFGTSDLFRLLSLQKKTGLLQLSDGKEKVIFSFLRGKLVGLNRLTRPAEKKKEVLRIALQMKKGKFYFKELPESDFDRYSLDRVDFYRLYKQMAVKEDLPYLQQKINSAVLKTAAANLFLLPAGDLPSNPTEFLGSERISFLISNLKKRFDVLIIDSPPILPASDALLLAPQTEGAVLIVKAGLMNRKIVQKIVEQLKSARANLVGVVLNQVDMKRDGYYKNYYKYYSEYYGESK